VGEILCVGLGGLNPIAILPFLAEDKFSPNTTHLSNQVFPIACCTEGIAMACVTLYRHSRCVVLGLDWSVWLGTNTNTRRIQQQHRIPISAFICEHIEVGRSVITIEAVVFHRWKPIQVGNNILTIVLDITVSFRTISTAPIAVTNRNWRHGVLSSPDS